MAPCCAGSLNTFAFASAHSEGDAREKSNSSTLFQVYRQQTLLEKAICETTVQGPPAQSMRFDFPCEVDAGGLLLRPPHVLPSCGLRVRDVPQPVRNRTRCMITFKLRWPQVVHGQRSSETSIISTSNTTNDVPTAVRDRSAGLHSG